MIFQILTLRFFKILFKVNYANFLCYEIFHCYVDLFFVSYYISNHDMNRVVSSIRINYNGV